MVAYAYESSMCPLFVCTFAEIFPHFKTLRENALKGTICYATPFKTLKSMHYLLLRQVALNKVRRSEVPRYYSDPHPLHS